MSRPPVDEPLIPKLRGPRPGVALLIAFAFATAVTVFLVAWTGVSVT